MELKEIKAITNQLIDDLKASDRGLIYRAYYNSLATFGMSNRKNFTLIDKIDYQLKKNGISVWCGREQRKSVSDVSWGETITL